MVSTFLKQSVSDHALVSNVTKYSNHSTHSLIAS